LSNDYEAEIIAWANGEGPAHQLNGADLGSGKGKTLLEALAFLAEKRRKQRKQFIKDRRTERPGASVHEDAKGAADFAPKPFHDQDMPDPDNGRYRTRLVFHARIDLGKVFRAGRQFVVSIGEASISFVPCPVFDMRGEPEAARDLTYALPAPVAALARMSSKLVRMYVTPVISVLMVCPLVHL
jgi:hypothetical protein